LATTCSDVGRARRQLALMLAGLPMASALHAATPPSAGAAAAPADGVSHTGRWVHAFAAYGAPKYGPDYTHFEYVNPDAPRGGTMCGSSCVARSPSPRSPEIR
jgi:ABC-type oligopeptide transport system substrate-binding subunit